MTDELRILLAADMGNQGGGSGNQGGQGQGRKGGIVGENEDDMEDEDPMGRKGGLVGDEDMEESEEGNPGGVNR